MKIYAIVPARSGSKGCPDKNIRKINGLPLLSYSINFAKKIKDIDRIFCSTDSSKYAEIAKSCGADVPFLRSNYASSDNAMEDDILRDLRIKFLEFDIEEPDFVVWLRPTFVFRSIIDVELCLSKIKEDNSISASRIVTRAENRLYEIAGSTLKATFNDKGKSMIRRQDMPESYKVFNTDIFRFKGNKFEPNYLGNNIFPVVSSPICGLDIDDVFDFEVVKNIVETDSEVINEFL